MLYSPQQENNSVRTILARLTALMEEISEVKQALTSPKSAINKNLKELQTQVTKEARTTGKQ